MKQESNCRLLDWLICCILIFQSGSILAISHYYKQTNIVIFCALLVIALLSGMRYYPKRSGLFCLFLMLLVSVNFIRGNTNSSSYLAIILQLLSAYLISAFLTIDKFIEYYTKIMVFLAAVSIPLFFLGFIFPSFVFKLPQFQPVAHVSYYNMMIYEYKYSVLAYCLETRNSSIFWEPGAYAFFINLALFFVIDKGDFTKKTNISITILIAALITTLSTTGFLIFGLLAWLYLKKNKKSSKILVALIAVIVLVLLSTSMEGFEAGTTEKFLKLASDSQHIIHRLDIDDLQNAFGVNFLWPLIGLTFEGYEAAIGSAANSIIYYSISLGLIFGGTLLALLFHQRKSFSKDARLVYVLMLLLSLSSESLMLKPLILYLCFAQSQAGLQHGNIAEKTV